MTAQKKNVSLKTVYVRIVNTIKVRIGTMNHCLNKKLPVIDTKTTTSGQIISTNRNSIVPSLLLLIIP